ncbi:MAG: polysaccharide pyruvyl transferase family protein, partial [Bacteroidia bacterium]|nr:polysaccharide pyruvyl transferase family protein [Bacteroidia bacterium]
MKITIIGWYGTETIGDRAILAGILQSLKNSYSDIEIKLGSLFPFFSERTLSEDAELYTEFTGMNIPIELFNSKKINELDDALKDSDLLIMGGGPLMHIHPLFMVEYAFKKAKKLGKQTVVMGCGVGPLFKKIHQKSLFNI